MRVESRLGDRVIGCDVERVGVGVDRFFDDSLGWQAPFLSAIGTDDDEVALFQGGFGPARAGLARGRREGVATSLCRFGRGGRERPNRACVLAPYPKAAAAVRSRAVPNRAAT